MALRFKKLSGGSSGGGLIEVDALPSEGQENTVYALKKQPTYIPYFNVEELGVTNLIDYAQQGGATVEIVDVVDSKDELPTENIKEVTSDTEMIAYYVRNDNYYMYGPFSEDGSKVWFSLSDYFEGMPFKGEVTSVDEMTELNSLYTLVIPNDSIDYYMYENSVPTQVPTTGLVENLYFNTKLSIEEVDAILRQLTYEEDGDPYVIGGYMNGSTNAGLICIIEANTYTQGQVTSGYLMAHMPNSTSMESTEILYVSNQEIVDLASSMGMTAKVGWNMETLNLNKELVAMDGSQNDKLINVISVTPYSYWTKISGGGATVKATPEVVPNTGFVERIYLNKSLSFDEVNAICTKANDLVANELLKANVIACNKDVNKLLAVSKYTDTDDTNINVIVYPGLATVIWSEKDYYAETDGSITQWKKGWNIEEDYLEFNDEVVAEANIFADVTCGTYNDQLTELFSINNVFETNEIKVSGEYDGSTITVSNMEVEGTAIPNTKTTIENVYINTDLSVDEVVSLLSQLTYQSGTDSNTHVVFQSENHGIIINELNGAYVIRVDAAYVFASNAYIASIVNAESVGWNTAFITEDWTPTTPNAVNEEIWANGEVDTPLGAENDKLTKLFSITPFEEKPQKNFDIDIKALLEQNKLPLNIKVDAQSLDVYVPIKYEIQHLGNVNVDFSNAVFNNPDNIPIYKDQMKLEIIDGGYKMTWSFKKTAEEIVFKTESGGSVSEMVYYNRYTSNDSETGVCYYIKLNDLINKEVPYLSNVIISEPEGYEGANNYVSYMHGNTSVSKCEESFEGSGIYQSNLSRTNGVVSTSGSTTLNNVGLIIDGFVMRYKEEFYLEQTTTS